MADRSEPIARFIARAGWGGAAQAPLAGDASARRYFRLQLGDRRAVLMDAAPDGTNSTARFLRMAEWLRDRGYSAPRIFAADTNAGFLLLEDLGDALIARELAADPGTETELYTAATDFLGDLHCHPAPDFVTVLDGPALADLVALTPLWYLPGIGAPQTDAAQTLPARIAAEYARLVGGRLVPCLRDFHAENLIWLPERAGPARLGLLDFQDAVAADPAYDLVSLLQDVRRDVTDVTEAAMIRHYCTRNRQDEPAFRAVYALLGAQRALRILGVFARLSMQFGKPGYLPYIPRLWHHLLRNLAHPELAGLRDAVHAALPDPTPERISRIHEQCGSRPAP